MSNDYVSSEVRKVVEDKKWEFPLNMAMASAWVLGNLKGLNLKVIDVRETSTLADYYVLASATNSTQAKAMLDTITAQLKRHGMKVKSTEGSHDSEWVLIDLGDIIVHVFVDPAREIYALDQLWKESPVVKIPQEFYFSTPEQEEEEENPSKADQYF